MAFRYIDIKFKSNFIWHDITHTRTHTHSHTSRAHTTYIYTHIYKMKLFTINKNIERVVWI